MKTMYLRQKGFVLFLISSFSVLLSCSDDNISDDMKLSLLYIEQAKTSWNGTTNNYYVDIYNSNQTDTTLTIGLGLYQNYKGEAEDVTVELIVDNDSLQKAIALSATDDSYKMYKTAKLLPSRYYTMPQQLSLKGGENKSEVEVLLKKSELLENAHTAVQGGIYIIPLKISNPSKYRVNPTVHFVMYVLRFPGNQLDPTKPDPTKPAEIEGYELFWNDEFNGEGSPDAKNWNFENGFVRNNELQWYQGNNAVCGGGVLTISGKKERVKNPNYQAGSSDWKKNREYAEYTSTSMTTAGKMSYTFGRLDVRAKIPTATGSWPAIWMLGTVGDWPFDGEIDVLEYYLKNGVPHIHANFCWGGGSRWESKWNSYSEPYTNFTSKNPNWANEFHVWTYEWDKTMSRFYIDGVLFREVWTNSMWNGGGHGYTDPQTGKWETDWRDPFHWPHYILLNLAIGSNGGTPDESAFPLKYEIDYVRIYQKKN